jgi:hypothetical protein
MHVVMQEMQMRGQPVEMEVLTMAMAVAPQEPVNTSHRASYVSSQAGKMLHQ